MFISFSVKVIYDREKPKRKVIKLIWWVKVNKISYKSWIIIKRLLSGMFIYMPYYYLVRKHIIYCIYLPRIEGL